MDTHTQALLFKPQKKKILERCECDKGGLGLYILAPYKNNSIVTQYIAFYTKLGDGSISFQFSDKIPLSALFNYRHSPPEEFTSY